MTRAAAGHRIELDLLGELEIPADAYFGVHTSRAVENFPISGIPISYHPELIWGLAAVKEAAALANRELGLLDARRTDAIVAACGEIRAGGLRDQFVVDVVQGGAGTSTNMNANEVVANRGLELLGRARGDYAALHPIDHVNASQSTNDVYPTAVRIGLDRAVVRLLEALARLRGALDERAAAFAGVVKMGRTQLQDAVPMTVEQEFTTYAVMVGEDELRLAEARTLLHEVNLGGTAIGTGLNAHPAYRGLACGQLARITGIPVASAPDLVEATQDCGAFVQLSGVLKRIAVKVSKVCNDLRLLSSGPRSGLGEITLPAVQAGSSIMPGKVNPVIPEAVNQVAFEIVGNDVTISMAAEGGQLQLNAFEPIIAHRLFEGFRHLAQACEVLADRCVGGIGLDHARLRETVARSIGVATALNPYLGYATASEIAKEALATGASVGDLVVAHGLMSQDELRDVLSAERIAGLRPQLWPDARV